MSQIPIQKTVFDKNIYPKSALGEYKIREV